MCQGMITREHTIWCYLCSNWHQDSEPSKVRFKRMMLKAGWRSFLGSWICPKCCARWGSTVLDRVQNKIK